MTIPALAAALIGGAQYFASADEQVAARRPRRVMVPNPYAPQYCPPPAPVCPPSTLPAPQPTPVQPSAPSTTPPTNTTPTTPAPSTTTPNTTPSDPNDLRTQAPAQPQDQAQAPQNNFQPQADQSLASAADAQSAAPNIIGDFFGSTGGGFFFTQNVADAVGSFGVGSVASTFRTTDGRVFGFADGRQVGINNPSQSIGSPGQPLVELDPQTLQPLPGGNAFTVLVVNGRAIVQQSQQGVGSFPAVNAGKIRLAESTSPIPRDRLFFNYSYFNDVPLAAGGVSVNRYTFGVEKTFFNGMTSLELRAPFSTTLSTDRVFQGANDLSDRREVEMADMLLTGKLLLWQSETFAFSTGVSFSGPTSGDTNVFTLDRIGQNNVLVHKAQIDHSAFHVLPFVGAVWTPDDSWFVQSLLQIDQPFNGDTVRINPTGDPGAALVDAGRLNDQTFAYWTLSTGYWLFRENTTDDWGLSGVAPIVEMHYNTSLNDQDSLTFDNGNRSFGGNSDNIELINATVGVVTQWGWNKSLYIGYAAPIGSGEDQQFDGELRAIFNWRFGAQQFRNVPVFQ